MTKQSRLNAVTDTDMRRGFTDPNPVVRNKHDVIIHSHQVATGVEAADLCMNIFSSPEQAY